MNSVDFFIVLGELIFGRINNDSAKAGDVRFANSAWGLSAQIDAHWHVDLHFAVSRDLDGGRVYKAAYAEVRKEQGTPE